MSEINYTGSWPARITSWDMKQVEGKGWVLEIWWRVTGDNWTKNIRWDGWFLKSDGTRNENTYKTLRTCGFAGSDLKELASDDALDTETEFNVSVEASGDYWKVKWVNEKSWQAGAMVDKTVLQGHDLSKLNSFLGPAKPKANGSSDTDIDDFLNT